MAPTHSDAERTFISLFLHATLESFRASQIPDVGLGYWVNVAELRRWLEQRDAPAPAIFGIESEPAPLPEIMASGGEAFQLPPVTVEPSLPADETSVDDPAIIAPPTPVVPASGPNPRPRREKRQADSAPAAVAAPPAKRGKKDPLLGWGSPVPSIYASHFGREPGDVRVVTDATTGKPMVYDTDVPVRFLNEEAPEFHPGRIWLPSSALLSSSSATLHPSSAPSRSWSAYSTSSSTSSATLLPSFASDRPMSRLSTRASSPGTAVPVYPDLQPAASWKAASASRLAPHAPCGKDAFLARLRSEGLAMFNAYWKPDGPWRYESRGVCDYLTSRGVNIAAFVGSLFRVGVLHAGDAHYCANVLLRAGPSFVKLLAVHALVVHSGPTLCASSARARAAASFNVVRAKGADGRFVWGPHEESHVLLLDLIGTLDSWFASDDMRMIHERAALFTAPSATSHGRK
ncbi:hypothetical protein GGX14DRAFT_701434 [Mycena pura]|uniref:Uncharacterized protein n=1 Tax=Mycena pura TaxID=153505 RepID=A0AAD6UQ49_9AGAR|nr:hypothetical protein GGX14DRAFT_701434 [Mycena pura]